MSEYDKTEFEKEIKKEWPVERIIDILWKRKGSDWKPASLNSETSAIYGTNISGYEFMLKKKHNSYGLSEKLIFSVEMQKGNLPSVNYGNKEEIKKLEPLGKKVEHDIEQYQKRLYKKGVREFKKGLEKLLSRES